MILNICHRSLKIYENNLKKRFNYFAGKMMIYPLTGEKNNDFIIQAEQGGIHGRNKHPKYYAGQKPKKQDEIIDPGQKKSRKVRKKSLKKKSEIKSEKKSEKSR